MKKILFFVLACIPFSCQENSVEKPSLDYSAIMTNLDLVLGNTFNTARLAGKESISITSLDYLKANYYQSNLDLSGIDSKLSARASSALDLSFLTPFQEAIARPFLEDVVEVEEISDLSGIVAHFESAIANSSLVPEQKYQLYVMCSLVKQAGILIAEVQDDLLAGKINGEINVKEALRAGVESLAAGAVYGAYVGATGGTMTVPIVGTVVAGVGCAVVGGAVGFVTGVVGSIASQLFWD
ncbi:MAG: hypothetical protein JNJ75_15750 [Cyclobacteriaceae bacterium]|nr:hypothetical protein [Cyclobacteriaceae bacterium]